MRGISRGIGSVLVLILILGMLELRSQQTDMPFLINDTTAAGVKMDSGDTLAADTLEGRYLQVTTTTGETFRGQVVRTDSAEIVLKQEVGRFTILRSKIAEMQVYTPGDPSSLWFTNPNKNRMFVMPTARMMEEGEGYYQNMYVLISSVSIGFSDHVTGSVGASMVPGIPLDSQLLFASVKVGTKLRKRLHGAAGFTFLNAAEEQTTFAYGIGTYGTTDYQVTAGYGRGLGEGGFRDQTNMLILGGEARISEHIALSSENWLGEEQIVSYGVRFIGERVSADLAFFRILEEDVGLGALGIPYVDFVYFF